jgi:hypothetical protein
MNRLIRHNYIQQPRALLIRQLLDRPLVIILENEKASIRGLVQGDFPAAPLANLPPAESGIGIASLGVLGSGRHALDRPILR